MIELLVVVAIIGVLSTIVLSSLNDARNRAKDAAIKASLNSFRTQTELIYLETGSYDTICTLGTSTADIFLDAFEKTTKGTYQNVCSSSSGGIIYSLNNTATTGGKLATPERWGVSLRLPGSRDWFCVDYSGIAREQNSIGIYFDGNGTDDVDC